MMSSNPGADERGEEGASTDEVPTPGGGSKPRIDMQAAAFADKLVKNPAAPPSVRVLSGFVAASARENHTRIYQRVDFSEYFDVPNDAILHAQPAGAEGSDAALGRSLVWVERDAAVFYTVVETWQGEADFLRGTISDRMCACAGPCHAADYGQPCRCGAHGRGYIPGGNAGGPDPQSLTPCH